jgi:hypothetical protein
MKTKIISFTNFSCLVMLTALLSISVPVLADIVNQDTGEHWHPTMDEDGNPETPPDWVPQEDEQSPSDSNGSSSDDENIDTDQVLIAGRLVDFGASMFSAGMPVGFGRLVWSITDGFYTPRLIGTLHLNNASGKFARMHISYLNGGDGLIDVRHGGIVRSDDNDHHSWSVDLSPLDDPGQITEVHICTEISDDGINFSQVSCTTKFAY